MNPTRRTGRFIWVFGIVLLVATVAGAGWVLNNGQPDAPQNPPDIATTRNRVPESGNFSISLGHADVEQGLTPLHPLVGGEIVELKVKEGDPVSKGDVLLRLDDRLARADKKRAEADLKAAEAQVKKLEQTRDDQARKVANQKAVVQRSIEAAKANAEAMRALFTIQKKLFDQKESSAEQLAAHQKKLEAAEALTKVEEAKLNLIEEIDLKYDIERAVQDVEGKKEQLHKAKIALEKYVVTAPEKGMVLRLSANLGEALSTTPKLPAVLFCPAKPLIIRAEVQQEFAAGVRKGQVAVIEDDTRSGAQWSGKVQSISPWFTGRRSRLMEPFQFNDVRTVEAIVTVDPSDRPLRIGQRVRVIIRHAGP